MGSPEKMGHPSATLGSDLLNLQRRVPAYGMALFRWAWEAMGHGIRAKRSKSGAVSFDLVEMEVRHASVQ